MSIAWNIVVRFGLIASSLASVSVISAQQRAPARHATADTASAARPLRLYLSPIRVDSGFRLTPNSYSGTTHVEQNVVFGSRPDTGFHVAPVVGVPARAIDTWNAVQFVSPPIPALELSALFSGHLDFITNRKEFDFRISLYELTSDSNYVLLSVDELRWTNTPDSSGLLTEPSTRRTLDFRSENPGKAVVRNGSRLVVLITILKAAEDIAGTIEALRISWYGESYVQVLHASRS
jgi:hypothetical protein